MLAVALSLSACGGGGGGGGGGGMAVPAAAPPAEVKPAGAAATTSCSACGGLEVSSYSGSGTAVWQGINKSQVSADVPLTVTGLDGQTVTLVLTNESAQDQAMAGIVLRSNVERSATASKAMLQSAEGVVDSVEAQRRAIGEFNRAGFGLLIDPLSKAQPAVSKSMAPSAAQVVNDQRQIYLYDHSQRTVKLAAQRAASDGTVVNVWVETSELAPTRISTELAARMRDKFAAPGGIYDMLVRTGGPLWGEHAFSSQMVPGSGQPVDIFFVNFEANSKPYGLIGYFWGLNNFKTGSGELAYSNESLSLYLDSESLYLDGETGVKQIATAMAHEGLHMQNFYRRGVKMGSQYTYDTWLEEMSALMMEDWASFNIDPSHNAIRDTRFPYYLAYNGSGSYNCTLSEWTPMGASCESYALTGSFGGFLNRQFGLEFYKALLNSTGIQDSTAILDGAIKASRPGSSLGQELRRFSATAAGVIPLGAGIAQYSMPARDEGGFSLPAIDPSSLGRSQRALPQAVPELLHKLGSFPVVRPGLKGTYTETVRVPAGTTLSVIVN
ncbi:M30 family zinc metallopeptidase [Variovorax saccharolyticus]|uniref:M30 family zinc metallopeptidase n=1 Tax=Variovorax saccharolyticus TaxID=3053516 RepID=UPI002574F321|nr:hemagglutinin [Variovorax sp. J31P216]MDM0029737.1 hemagglutinin [Variovorax sp. J31P216]